MLGKNAGVQRPTIYGMMTQAAGYGLVTPKIYGLTKFSPIAIWLQNLRQGGSDKKFKEKKKGPPTYIANIDFLAALNPVLGMLACWNNNETKYQVNYQTYSVVIPTSGSGKLEIVDPRFYAVIAVTVAEEYSVMFDDYGGSGPQTLTGMYDVPLFNDSFVGPNPSYPNSYRFAPYTYRWNPTYGNFVYFDAVENRFDNPLAGLTATVHYAQLTYVRGYIQSPLETLRLTFESELGNGPEFAGPLATQQIIYDEYCGLGSASMDCGSSAMIPTLQFEGMGSYTVYGNGDCDIPDIIEDIACSGPVAAGYDNPSVFSDTQHGTNLYNYPLVVQQRFISQGADLACGPMTFPNGLKAGDVIIFGVMADSGTIFDAPEDTSTLPYTTLYSNGMTDGWPYGLFYRVVSTDEAANNAIDLVPYANIAQSYFALVLRGCGQLDTKTLNVVTTNPGPGNTWPVQGSITTSNGQGDDAFVLAFVPVFSAHGGNPAMGDPAITGWQPILLADNGPATWNVYVKRVTRPGTYTLQGMTLFEPAEYDAVLVSFIAAQPRSVAVALGSIIDETSMDLMRTQCRAYGLTGALTMDAQRKAVEWITDLYYAGNTYPFYSGFKLKCYPRAEASAVGNGAVYYAPTRNGPIYNLTVDNGDFVGDTKTAPVQVVRKAQAIDAPNIYKIQIPCRNNDYNAVTIAQPLAGAAALAGPRPESAKLVNCVASLPVARKLVTLDARRAQMNRNMVKFVTTTRYQLGEPGDLWTVTDPKNGDNQLAIQPTSIIEDESYLLTLEADLFIYGMNTPDDITATDPTGSGGNRDGDPGYVNPPIIFQPVPRLLSNQNQPEVWFVVSGESLSYGGCVLFISTDGGDSYNILGTIYGNSVTGYLTAGWPANADPDSVNPLSVDLSESNGTLSDYPVTDENNFVYPFYVDGGGTGIIIDSSSIDIAIVGAFASSGIDIAAGVQEIDSSGSPIAAVVVPSGPSPQIPYELGSYADVTMTGSFQYTMPVGNPLSDPVNPPAFHRQASPNSTSAWDDVNKRLVYVKSFSGSTAVLSIIDVNLGYSEITIASRIGSGMLPYTLLANQDYIFMCSGGIHWDAYQWDGTVVVGTAPGWHSCDIRSVGDRVEGLVSGVPYIFQCSVAGSSGLVEPTWTLSGAGESVDCLGNPSTLVWVCVNGLQPAPDVVAACLVGNRVVYTGSTGGVYVLDAADVAGAMCSSNLVPIPTHYGGFFTAAQMVSDGTYVWVLNGGTLSPGVAYLGKVDIAALSTVEYAVGSGTAIGLFGLEYNAGYLYYWLHDGVGNIIRQWEISTTADTGVSLVASGSAGFGPIRNGVLPYGYTMLTAATLVPIQTLSGTVNFNPATSGIGNSVFQVQYDVLNNRYWLLAGDNYVALGIPDVPAFTYIRRAVFGAPLVGQGVVHPVGARFCTINNAGVGVLKVPLDPIWINQELKFKLCPFNAFGTSLKDPSDPDVLVYTFTPGTLGVTSDYTQSPSTALSQPAVGIDDYFVINMLQVTETFPSNPVNYNARSFPVPDPGGSPTTYYITIADPGMLGDTGTLTDRTAYCEVTASKVGVTGYTYIGSITVTHTGGVTGTPGGWPQ